MNNTTDKIKKMLKLKRAEEKANRPTEVALRVVDPHNLIGVKFGDYVVMNGSDRDGSCHILWECTCPKCHDSFKTTSYELISGRKNTVCKNCVTSLYNSSDVLVGDSDGDTTNDAPTKATAGLIPILKPNGYEVEEYDIISDFVYARELKEDLLELPTYYHICHCIPCDFTFHGITAKRIYDCYNLKEKWHSLKEQFEVAESGIKVGTVYMQNNLFTLFVTEKKHQRPTLEELRDCVKFLADLCWAYKITYLGMPRIGCGHNKLNWDDVKQMIYDEFVNTYNEHYHSIKAHKENYNGPTPIKITFCYQ